MIGLVSGLHRTGTSMMVRALAMSSQLRWIWSEETERRIRSREVDRSYDPNPHGYRQSDRLPTEMRDGELAKVLPMRLLALPKGQTWRVVLMRRDERAATESFRRAFGLAHSDFERRIFERATSDLAARPNVELRTLDYDEVVSDPLAAFEGLATAGWPIDPEKAARTVDPTLRRHSSLLNA